MTPLFHAGRPVLAAAGRAGTIAMIFARELARVDRPIERRIRLACEALGATFVKGAQVLASTYGIVPERLSNELRGCLDQLSPLPGSVIRAEAERALGQPLSSVFATFDDVALASASVAQVHRARLLDGSEVVVKVKRPGVERRLALDIALIRWLVRPIRRWSSWAATMNLDGVVDEFERTVNEELDFAREGEFMTAYRKKVAEIDAEHFVIPAVHAEHSRRDLLVLDEIKGIPFTRPDEVLAAGFDGYELLAQLLRVWLEVMVRHGHYHGDLHGGNLLFVPPRQIALVDFGVVGVLGPRHRRAVIDLLLFTALGDDRLLARHYKDMGYVPADTDEALLKQRMKAVLDKVVNRPLEDQRFEDLFRDMIAAAHDLGGQVPREVMLLSRQQIYLAAHGRRLAPGKDILRHPCITEIIFPPPAKRYIPAPEGSLRYRLPLPGDAPSAGALPCPICTIVIESNSGFAAGGAVYCYACFTALTVVASQGQTIELQAT